VYLWIWLFVLSSDLVGDPVIIGEFIIIQPTCFI
jgi:hypothetical protein